MPLVMRLHLLVILSQQPLHSICRGGLRTAPSHHGSLTGAGSGMGVQSIGRKTIRESKSRGAALVELAIALPILLLLVFGAIDFGLMLKDSLALRQVAREAARSAAVGGNQATVQAHIDTWADNLGLTENVQSSIEAEDQPGTMTTVTLTYPHTVLMGKLIGLPDTVQLNATMVMRRE